MHGKGTRHEVETQLVLKPKMWALQQNARVTA